MNRIEKTDHLRFSGFHISYITPNVHCLCSISEKSCIFVLPRLTKEVEGTDTFSAFSNTVSTLGWFSTFYPWLYMCHVCF